jgi:predicted site-specific integrase-resolvase
MNDNRPRFWKMLGTDPTVVVVEHKDRLTRFGFRYIEGLLAKQGCKVEVLNRDAVDEQDIMKDMVAIVTSFCCRLYGARRGQNKARAAKELLARADG